VRTVQVATRDALALKTTQHRAIGQNARVLWHFIGPGPGAGGDAVYGACEPLRKEPDGRPQDTPPLFRIDLTNGKLSEYFVGGKVVRRKTGGRAELTEKGLADDEPGDAAEREPLVTGWGWGKPTCGAGGPDRKVYFGSDTGWVIRYYPAEGAFQQYFRLNREVPAALAASGEGGLYVLCESRVLYFQDALGRESLGKAPLGKGPIAGLAIDDGETLYAAVGPAPWRVYALRNEGRRLGARPLLANLKIASVRFQGDRSPPWCEVEVVTGGHSARRNYRLQGGRATLLKKRPGPDLTIDFSVDPSVTVRRPGRKPLRVSFVLSKAVWDKCKSISVGPDGRKIFGAGWPTAWIWEFDPRTNRLRRRGRDYVWYEIIPRGDELFAIGYWGIKLMRWNPAAAWTFDYQKHYYKKKPYAANYSPWGAKGSNPRLVCKFRYFHNLHIRRPSGFALGGDGRFYCGAKNAGYMFYGAMPSYSMSGTRYSGALCWYDPKTETIGTEREPFLHHEVADVCSIGKTHIAMAAKAAGNPFEPAAKPYTRGKFALFDVRTRRFVHQGDPTGGKLWYVEEGAPGHAVIVASPGRYAGAGIRSVLFVFDVKTMRSVRVVRLPVAIRWNQYDASDKFERGPDGRIYFYGTDEQGTAMFGFDSRTGAVEPVFREKGVTDFKVYTTPGAAFCFAGDRVYFGASHVRSLPLHAVVKGK